MRTADCLAPNVFDALSDPTRREILELLRRRPHAAGEIAAHFTISRPAISKHVRLLKKAGLVHETVNGRQRIYSLHARPLIEIDAWLQPYRAFWAARLVELKDIIEAQEEGKKDDSP